MYIELNNKIFKLVNDHLYCTLQRLPCLVPDRSNNNDADNQYHQVYTNNADDKM